MSLARSMLTVLILGWLPALAVGAGDDPVIEKLLESADPARLTEWGIRYEHGEGVERSQDRAIRLYCVAAWEGDARAQYQLGWIYANGRGLPRDDGLAAAWFRLAAEQGDEPSKKMLIRVEDRGSEEFPRCIRPDGKELYALPTGNTAQDRERTTLLVRRLAPRYGLDPALVLALIQIESNFDPNARSPKNAQGLMQLIPATARRFGVQDIMHPLENLRGGMEYLRWLLDHFDGEVALALAGYNAGEGAVERYRGIPPYRETRHYVKAVTRLYDNRSASLARGS